MNRPAAILVIMLLATVPAVSATSFASGTDDPLPNITEVRIHDVTGLSDSQKEVSGTLVDRGLNETFLVNQSEERQYRFTFRIVNDGNSTWDINDTGTDVMFHDGLDTGWSVPKIWYNITQDYDSGTFSSAKVDWNTSKGGSLDPGQEMFAKYLVNISVSSSSSYRLNFKVNETLENAGSYDYHRLEVDDLGWLNVTIYEPPNDTGVAQNATFILNSSVTCEEGECGEVTVNPRYNESSEADTVIPRGSGKPFYVNSSRDETCDTDLLRDETCFTTWFVNSTGELESWHLLDGNASSSYSGIAGNDSKDHQVQINRAVIFNITWNNVSFGVVDPGEKNISAFGNDDLQYNLTVDPYSQTIDSLWIRAEPLNSSEDPDYNISPRNISYSNTNDISTESFLSESYQLVKENLDPGSLLQFFFWLDAPTGIAEGTYNETLYIKGNSTV